MHIPAFTDHAGSVEQIPYLLCGGVLHVGKVVTAGHYQAFYFPGSSEDIWSSHLMHDDDSQATSGTAASSPPSGEYRRTTNGSGRVQNAPRHRLSVPSVSSPNGVIQRLNHTTKKMVRHVSTVLDQRRSVCSVCFERSLSSSIHGASMIRSCLCNLCQGTSQILRQPGSPSVRKDRNGKPFSCPVFPVR